jgi:hypothetical protein
VRANASFAASSSVVKLAGRIAPATTCASRAAVTLVPAVFGMCAK